MYLLGDLPHRPTTPANLEKVKWHHNIREFKPWSKTVIACSIILFQLIVQFDQLHIDMMSTKCHFNKSKTTPSKLQLQPDVERGSEWHYSKTVLVILKRSYGWIINHFLNFYIVFMNEDSHKGTQELLFFFAHFEMLLFLFICSFILLAGFPLWK